jgi:PKD repeat protein
MQNDLDAHYVLVSDVDCSSYSGFSSFGYQDNPFTGVLDGQGHVVENLTIDEPNSPYVGLIGYLGSGGEVKNIGVVNADITGGGFNVGGLVGVNDGGSVSNSFSTGSVSGSFYYVGGLVGANRGSGSVSNSFSTGSVSASDLFSTEGGLVGYNHPQGSVSSSYWDTESSGQSSGIGDGSGDVTGLTTSEMQGESACSSMDGLDFGGIWTPVSGGYPNLITSAGSGGLTCNSPPSASFTSNSPVLTGEGFGLDASGSSDPDGDSLTYKWDLDDDGNYDDATGVSPSVSRGDDGSYTIGLKVSDGNGGSDTTSKSITVENRAPSASFSSTPSSPSIGESVTFDASGSSDQDGSISSYEWDWDGDGSYEATGKIPSHSFSSPGDYSVVLRVTDDDGATDIFSDIVTVFDRSDPLIGNLSPTSETGRSPTISADFSDNYQLSDFTLYLDGVKVDSGSLSGTSGNGSFSASGLSPGQHSYNFTVSDSSDNTVSVLETFTVNLLNSQPNTGTVRGALWVQEGSLRWGDGSTEYWIADAENLGSVSGPDGALWVQGSALRWIEDEDERSYEGSLVSPSVSAPPGALWVQDGLIHYVDESGGERVVDGS